MNQQLNMLINRDPMLTDIDVTQRIIRMSDVAKYLNNSYVTHLTIHDPSGGDEHRRDVYALMNELVTNTTVTNLTIEHRIVRRTYDDVHDPLRYCLFNMLTANKHINALIFSDYIDEDDQLIRLGQALRVNNTLTAISIQIRDIADSAMIEFFESLKLNTSIESITIEQYEGRDEIPMSDIVLNKLIELILVNRRLMRIVITGLTITEEQLIYFMDTTFRASREINLSIEDGEDTLAYRDFTQLISDNNWRIRNGLRMAALLGRVNDGAPIRRFQRNGGFADTGGPFTLIKSFLGFGRSRRTSRRLRPVRRSKRTRRRSKYRSK